MPIPEPYIHLVQANFGKDYQLIDSGNGYKLERFGQMVLARPEPQALWSPSLSQKEWQNREHFRFLREPSQPEKGEWRPMNKVSFAAADQSWPAQYRSSQLKLNFQLRRTGFKHVGLFPEQCANWEWLYTAVKNGPTTPKTLNLFAYTGGASLAMQAAGAKVVHVDSVRNVVDWGRRNMEASGLDGISWVVEDARLFAEREAKRGNRYSGIVLDPPAYGRGPKGEKWVQEDQLLTLLQTCARLLEPKGFVLLSLYSLGQSALIAQNLMTEAFGSQGQHHMGEIYLKDDSGRSLPQGLFYRLNRADK